MKRTVRQGGSVKIFIVMAVILSSIALGALYGTKRLAMNDQTPPMVVPEVNQDSTDEQADKQDQPADTPTSTDQADQNNQSSQGNDSNSGLSNSQEQNLPQSGPADGLSAVALSAVTVSAVAYIRSLRRF